MKKRSLGALLLLTLSLVLPANSFPVETEGVADKQIEYLEAADFQKLGPVADLSIGNVFLDPVKSAYVVDSEVFDALEPLSLNDYLGRGGTVILKDKYANYDKVTRKLKTNAAKFDFSKDPNYFGLFIVRKGTENAVYNVNLGYLTLKEEGSELSTDNIAVTEVAEAIVEGVDDLELAPQPIDQGTDLAQSSQLSGDITGMGSGILHTVLFLEATGERAASYTINTTVYNVARVLDSNTGNVRGVYDVITIFSMQAFDPFWVSKARSRMMNYNMIIDHSVLKSQTTTNVRLLGSLPFANTPISGSLSNAYTYTNYGYDQNINNEGGLNSWRFWTTTMTKEQKGLSHTMVNAIRVVSTNDAGETAVYSRLEYFEVAKMVLFIFVNKYYMGNAYRKELKLVFSPNGYSQEVIVG